MERKALGKGITALIPVKEIEKENVKEAKIIYLTLDLIKPSPFQPREDFDTQSLEELTQSIKEKGFIQPILVRPQGDYYELIAGERRFRAANMLNLKEIPAIIKEADDSNALELSLIENIQRQNLNPIEEARAYQCLMDKFNLTQEKVSELLGKARTTVANTMRLLKLPQEIQDEIKKSRLSFAHGRAILEVEDSNEQRLLAQKVIINGLSVRELENLIKKHRPRSAQQRTKKPVVTEPFVPVLENELQHALATKVRIIKRKKRGHIVIEFYSEEDLKRITRVIKGAQE